MEDLNSPGELSQQVVTAFVLPSHFSGQGSQEKKVLLRRKYQSCCPHSHHSYFPVSLGDCMPSGPGPALSLVLYLWGNENQFLPTKRWGYFTLRGKSFKNLLWDIALSLHDKLTEGGNGRNEALLFIVIKQLKDLYTLTCVFLGGPPHPRRRSQSSIKVSTSHIPVCLSPPHDFRSKIVSGAGIGGDWQQLLGRQQKWQARTWRKSAPPAASKPVNKACHWFPNQYQWHRNHRSGLPLSLSLPFKHKDSWNF